MLFFHSMTVRLTTTVTLNWNVESIGVITVYMGVTDYTDSAAPVFHVKNINIIKKLI